MKSIDVRIILAAINYILVLVTGIGLAIFGRPLQPVVFGLHKILAVTALILTILIIVEMQRNAPFQQLAFLLVICAYILMIMIFISGALLSFEKTSLPFIVLAHKIAPTIFIITVLLFYMTARKN